MKNKEMKVTELLGNKRDLESDLSALRGALSAIKNEVDGSGCNFDDKGSASIYARNHQYRFEIDRDLIQVAVEAKIQRVKEELEPIQKKLDAIELMLNS